MTLLEEVTYLKNYCYDHFKNDSYYNRSKSIALNEAKRNNKSVTPGDIMINHIQFVFDYLNNYLNNNQNSNLCFNINENHMFSLGQIIRKANEHTGKSTVSGGGIRCCDWCFSIWTSWTNWWSSSWKCIWKRIC